MTSNGEVSKSVKFNGTQSNPPMYGMTDVNENSSDKKVFEVDEQDKGLLDIFITFLWFSKNYPYSFKIHVQKLFQAK